MNTDETIYTLSYSFQQQCFHVETLDEMLKHSLSQFLRNDSAGYIPMVMSRDRKAINEISEAMRIRDDVNDENCRARAFTREEADHVAKVMAKHSDKLIGFGI